MFKKLCFYYLEMKKYLFKLQRTALKKNKKKLFLLKNVKKKSLFMDYKITNTTSNKYSRGTLIYLIVKILFSYLAGIHLAYFHFPPVWRGIENISSIVYT